MFPLKSEGLQLMTWAERRPSRTTPPVPQPLHHAIPTGSLIVVLGGDQPAKEERNDRKVVVALTTHRKIDNPLADRFCILFFGNDAGKLGILNDRPDTVCTEDDHVPVLYCHLGNVGLDEKLHAETLLEDGSLVVCTHFIRREQLHPHHLTDTRMIIRKA